MTKKDEKENEVTVIHEKSSLDYREYISISLKSANVAVDSLIEKASLLFYLQNLIKNYLGRSEWIEFLFS